MKTVTFSVFVIGVALSVAPIFNSAYAQSSADPARLVLDMQTMRAEIAELRDMVERQQFEIRKLKQASKNAASQTVVPVQPTPNYGQPQPNYGTAEQTEQGTQSAPAQAPATQAPNGAVNSFPDQYADPYLQNNQQPNDAPVQNVPQGGSYQRDLPQASLPESSVPQQGGPEIVDRTITAPAVTGRPAVNDGPEIVERSIGGYQGRATAPVLSSDSTPSAQAPVEYQRAPVIDASAPLEQPVDGAVPTVVPAVPTAPGQMPTASGQTPTVPVQTPTTPAQTVGNRPVLQVPEQVASATVPTNAGSPASLSEDQFYDRGFDLLKQSKYDDAVTVFKDQLASHPNGDLADDAHYWIAEAMFISRKPDEAKPHLRAIIDNYPQSARLPDAMLKTAYIEQDAGNVIEARILLQEIINGYPSSNAAIAAKNRLANIVNGQ